MAALRANYDLNRCVDSDALAVLPFINLSFNSVRYGTLAKHMKKNSEDRERLSRVALELLSDEKIFNYDAIPSLACASLDLKPESRRESEFNPKRIRPVEVWPGIRENPEKFQMFLQEPCVAG